MKIGSWIAWVQSRQVFETQKLCLFKTRFFWKPRTHNFLFVSGSISTRNNRIQFIFSLCTTCHKGRKRVKVVKKDLCVSSSPGNKRERKVPCLWIVLLHRKKMKEKRTFCDAENWTRDRSSAGKNITPYATTSVQQSGWFKTREAVVSSTWSISS